MGSVLDEWYDNHLNDEDSKLWDSILRTHLGLDQSREILGVETGYLTLKAAELGYKCAGAMISEEMITLAERCAEEKKVEVSFIKSTVESLPFADCSKDVILSCNLGTLPRPDVALNEWLRVLKLGGVLLCFCLIGKAENYSEEGTEDERPWQVGTEEMFLTALEEAGFAEVQGVFLQQIKDRQGDGDWYLIKGRKMFINRQLNPNSVFQISYVELKEINKLS